MNIETKVKGIINIQVKRNGVVRHDVTFENLILDTFFARFAANNTLFSTMICRVGTGTTTPANGDTALVSLVASANQTASSDQAGALDLPNNRIIASIVRQFEFTQGSVVANISEIGFQFAQSAGGVSPNSLNSRSLTKDAFGTPTPITVTADDQLIVNYRFQVIIPLVDYTATINISGVNYSVIGRIASNYETSVNNLLTLPVFTFGWFVSYGATSVFGEHGINPTAESGTQGGQLNTEYLNVSGGKEIEPVGTINQMNAAGGIKCITIPHGGSGRMYKYEFTPVLPKTNTKVLKLRFRMTCVRA